ncbi:MAG: O-antigen ligase family protein [Flavobacteriales bacterium]|nr:O-antigen ligase family protein [Flavobacteriales bacterium]
MSPVSKAAVSILSGFTALGIVFRIYEGSLQWRDVFKRTLLPLAILLLIQILDAPIHQGVWPDLKYVGLWLPLFLIPCAFSGISVDSALVEIGLLFVALIFLAIALGSIVNYGLHMEEVNRMLLESKHVPLFSTMHHIYFGLYLAALIWVSVYYYLRSRRYRRAWIWIGAALVICLHVLSSRTGLLGFYASIAVFGLVQVFKLRDRLNWKWVLPALIIPVLAFFFIPSLKYKWVNSMEDIRALRAGGEDLNFKSFGMRVESWKAGLQAIQNSPVMGHGNAAYKKEIQRAYEQIQTPLIPLNRIEPHNQFIETWGRNGLAGLFALMLLFLVPFSVRSRRMIALPLWMLFLFAFLLESVLQRQMGILLFSVFYAFFIISPNNSID